MPIKMASEIKIFFKVLKWIYHLSKSSIGIFVMWGVIVRIFRLSLFRTCLDFQPVDKNSVLFVHICLKMTLLVIYFVKIIRIE